ncbi:prepilin peptidase [archaeon]|nr:prepilin peptidase [archaeon]
MIELLVLIAISGSVLAGLWDLKTTEVPDEIPLLMIVLGISLLFVEATIKADFYQLFVSLVTGTVVLFLGLLNYKHGGWGAADAWIFASIIYMIPFFNNRLFVMDFFFNFLIVAAIYTIVYAIALGFKNSYVFSYVSKAARKQLHIVVGVPVIFSVLVSVLLAFRGIYNAFASAATFAAVLLAMLFWVYAKSVEKYVFRKKIPVSKLRAGDVLEDMVWKGLTEEEVMKIKKTKRFVFIKEGIRFVPVFPITLVITLLLGNLLFMILAM